MQFDLTPEVLDRIIFAMEDQTEEHVLDPASGEVLVRPPGSTSRDEGLVALPEWTPVHGYQLMERFAAGLRNPLLREEVRSALGAGKGVFRAFKDALRKRPEIEKRWYLYKEREMRRVVTDWYNQARELQGLERLSLEPADDRESSEQLIEADFVFSTGVEGREASIVEADRAAFQEVYAALGAERVEELYRRRIGKYAAVGAPESVVIVAEDHAGQLAGFAWVVFHPVPFAPPESWKIVQLFVAPGYRGIGLAGSLVRRCLESASDRGAAAVYVDLSEPLLRFGGLFAGQGFGPVAQLLGIDMSAWAERSTRAAG